MPTSVGGKAHTGRRLVIPKLRAVLGQSPSCANPSRLVLGREVHGNALAGRDQSLAHSERSESLPGSRHEGCREFRNLLCFIGACGTMTSGHLVQDSPASRMTASHAAAGGLAVARPLCSQAQHQVESKVGSDDA